uniref:Histidine-rich glycoprotein n=1 Tax=Trichuris muris TaxID=70415 RepID=A0A5S6QW80_TRIMR
MHSFTISLISILFIAALAVVSSYPFDTDPLTYDSEHVVQKRHDLHQHHHYPRPPPPHHHPHHPYGRHPSLSQTHHHHHHHHHHH